MKTEMERVSRPRGRARENYNSMSRWYDLFTSSEKRFTDIGIQMLDVQSNESILEIGCGTGHALTKLANKDAKVFAVDISEEMIKAARKRNSSKVRERSVEFCQADGLFIPFPGEQFDAVFLSFTLELFDTPEIPHVLDEIHRVLKEDGKLGIVALAKQDTSAIHIYEWFHRLMPNLVDCRPIYAYTVVNQAGFVVKQSKVSIMWGLPVETLVAVKWSSGRVAK